MPHDRWAQVGVAAALVVIVMFVSVSNLLSTRDGSRALDRLDRNQVTSVCVRRVNADADEEFQRDIGEVIDAAFARDLNRAHAALVRIKTAPNRADVIARKCPNSTTEGTP